jgi:hypothetical protein
MLETTTRPGVARNPHLPILSDVSVAADVAECAVPFSDKRRLPGFSRLASCSACLAEDIRVDYCPGSVLKVTSESLLCHADGVLDEHFHRTCTSCGRVWYEGILSALATEAR